MSTDMDAYWNDPEFGERRRKAHAKNYRCHKCGSVYADCADRQCPPTADATGYSDENDQPEDVT